MNDAIKQMLALQTRDNDIDRLAKEAAAIPAKITALRADIQRVKTDLEAAKKDLIQLQLAKKQKDLDLDAQEQAVRKHSGELNAVKTNEAYKALMGEIDKAKQMKSGLEDQVLQIMDQIDQANKIWKDRESASKGQESALAGEIQEWESKRKALDEQIASKKSEREQSTSTMSKATLEQYESLRKGVRGGSPIAVVRNEQCSGCHMKVSQNLINELRRGQKLIACESCSRIVYLDDADQAKPAISKIDTPKNDTPKTEPVL